MDKKTEDVINEFFTKRKFLTDEEFLKKMKPDDLMTYKEIKEKIYEPELMPKGFLTDLEPNWLTFMPNSKKTKNGMVMHFFDNPTFLQFKGASNYCKLHLTHAVRDSHIEAGNYDTALFLKVQNLQNAFIWWLVMRDKFASFLAHRTEVEIQGKGGKKTAGILMEEIKAKVINNQYAKEFKSLIAELENYRKKYEYKSCTWNNESFSLKDIGNDSKHNEDVLTKIMNEILSKSLDYAKFENFFYQQLAKGLLIARNEFIEIANRFINLFEKYIKNCLEKGMHSFVQN